MDIIPLPSQYTSRPGEFYLNPQTKIIADSGDLRNAGYLRTLLAPPTGFVLPILEGAEPLADTIRLSTNPELKSLGPEGYHLEVQPGHILLEAPASAGIFYGIQTLRQMLPPEIERRQLVARSWSIPSGSVSDQPRFSWRGFMLDEGRHFQGKESVLLTLELMALQKLNTFHWHLTEDQGWRIEIKKYPRLAELGSHRPGTFRSLLPSKKHDGVPVQGFYAQDDIRQIVAYAAERHITIVPEIEMPGHCTAALASYPELSCTGGPFEVATHFGVYPDIYCAGKEATFHFLQDVLDELLDLFPSRYIHLGGDEAPKKRWKACSDCQARMRQLGLKDEDSLQAWFIDRMVDYLGSKDRVAIGWNEILHAGLAENAAVQFWIGDRGKLIAAIRDEQRETVMSSYLDCYLDHGYNLMPLSRAYRYDPIPEELNGNATSILGLEFPLWTEWVPDRARLDYQAYPRLCALAETGWTPRDRKDLSGFRLRLGRFLERLEILGVSHASLREAEPGKLRRWTGMYTIAIPQTKIAG